MLKYNFDRVFKARGIDRPFTFLRQAGFSDQFATKIKNSRVSRMNLSHIERLCILLRCTPDDLYEWTPDRTHRIDKDHPMHKIKRSEKIVDITRTLNNVPLDQLDEIEEMILNRIKK